MSDEEEPVRGFTLQCSNDVQVLVTSEQAKILVAKCDFFRSVFAHGTTESSERIIHKPDWSEKTARRFVMLLTAGETQVNNIQEYESLKEATGQMLLEINLCFPSYVVDSTNAVMTTHDLSRYTDILQNSKRAGSSKCTFVTRRKISVQAWASTLDERIVIKDPKGFKIKLQQTNKSPGVTHISENFLLMRFSRQISLAGPKPSESEYLLMSESLSAAIRRVCGHFH